MCSLVFLCIPMCTFHGAAQFPCNDNRAETPIPTGLATWPASHRQSQVVGAQTARALPASMAGHDLDGPLASPTASLSSKHGHPDVSNHY